MLCFTEWVDVDRFFFLLNSVSILDVVVNCIEIFIFFIQVLLAWVLTNVCISFYKTAGSINLIFSIILGSSRSYYRVCDKVFNLFFKKKS